MAFLVDSNRNSHFPVLQHAREALDIECAQYRICGGWKHVPLSMSARGGLVVCPVADPFRGCPGDTSRLC